MGGYFMDGNSPECGPAGTDFMGEGLTAVPPAGNELVNGRLIWGEHLAVVGLVCDAQRVRDGFSGKD